MVSPFSWSNVNAGVPHESILVPLLFKIYINDLLVGLSSNTKLFPDDAIFPLVHNTKASITELNNELKKIND